MSRLTKWDEVRQCYVIDPDSTQNHIQRLGELEDRDEAKAWIMWTDDRMDYVRCPVCDYGSEGEILMKEAPGFCPSCGQRFRRMIE